MNAEIQILAELRSVKAHPLPSSRWALAATQALLRSVNRLHRLRFRRLMTRTLIRSSDQYNVPIVIIKPDRLQPLMPVLVYFHGGAFVMEGTPSHFQNAVRYAAEANCAVVFVEYRLAPQHVFPAGFNDCHAALLWTIANAPRLGVDATRVVVGGDSSGGNLAAGVAQRALQENAIVLKGQLLLYPAVDLLCTRSSMTQFKRVPPFKDLSAAAIADLYFGRAPSRPLPQYSSPIEGILTGLPPAYIETPQFDPLHDQAIDYAKALREVGVQVELNEIAGAIHAFDVFASKSGVSNEAMRRRIAFLQKVFASARL